MNLFNTSGVLPLDLLSWLVVPVTLHPIVKCTGGLLPSFTWGESRLVGRRTRALLLCLQFGFSWVTSLISTRTSSHVHVLSKGLSWCVLAPKVDTHFFVPMSRPPTISCFLCSSFLSRYILQILSSYSLEWPSLTMGPTVSSSASGLRTLAA